MSADTLELLAALDAVLGFIEQTIGNHRSVAEALRDGRRPTDEQMTEILVRLAADEAELQRLALRVGQLKAMRACRRGLWGDRAEMRVFVIEDGSHSWSVMEA